MKHPQFDMQSFEDACLSFPREYNEHVHHWFDEPMQWPDSHKYMPHAGVTADWGETFPNPMKREELTGGEQIRHMLNFMGRAQWVPNTLVLITHQGDRVELYLEWYQEVTPKNSFYYRPIEIINGVSYRGNRRPWMMSNVWHQKIVDPEKRKRAGLLPDPSYADMAAAGVTG